MELGSEGSERHGCWTWVASSKFLIRKLSSLRFFFCFFKERVVLCPGSRMTYALLMELYGFMVLETIYSKAPRT